jgi:hypothetical protein
LSAGAVAASIPRPAHGAERDARLRFEYLRAASAADCPDSAEVRAGVVARLGQDPFSPDAESTLRCEVSGDQSRRRARIELRDAAGRTLGRRVLTSPRNDCSELAPALLVVIASASVPGGALETPEPSNGRAKTVVPRAAPPPPDRDAPPATERRRAEAPAPPPASSQAAPPPADKARDEERDRNRPPTTNVPAGPREAPPGAGLLPAATVGVTLGSGTGPAAAWGGILGVGVRRGWGSLALEAFGTLPSSMAIGGGRISAFAAGASLVPCLRYGPLAACALAKAGALFGRGEDLPAARSAQVPWAAVGGRLAWQLALGARMGLELRAEALSLPNRTAVNAAGVVAWTTPIVAWNIGTALVVALSRRPREQKTDVPAVGQ